MAFYLLATDSAGRTLRTLSAETFDTSEDALAHVRWLASTGDIAEEDSLYLCDTASAMPVLVVAAATTVAVAAPFEDQTPEGSIATGDVAEPIAPVSEAEDAVVAISEEETPAWQPMVVEDEVPEEAPAEAAGDVSGVDEPMPEIQAMPEIEPMPEPVALADISSVEEPEVVAEAVGSSGFAWADEGTPAAAPESWPWAAVSADAEPAPAEDAETAAPAAIEEVPAPDAVYEIDALEEPAVDTSDLLVTRAGDGGLVALPDEAPADLSIIPASELADAAEEGPAEAVSDAEVAGEQAMGDQAVEMPEPDEPAAPAAIQWPEGFVIPAVPPDEVPDFVTAGFATDAPVEPMSAAGQDAGIAALDDLPVDAPSPADEGTPHAGEALADVLAEAMVSEGMVSDAEATASAADAEGYEAGASDITELTCDDCVYVNTCPKHHSMGPSACGSFQWRS